MQISAVPQSSINLFNQYNVQQLQTELEGAQRVHYIRQVNFTAVLLIYYRTLANCVNNDVIAM